MKIYLVLLGITILSAFVLFLIPPIPQWDSYHHFADDRKILGISNFGNVVSNAPLAFIGFWGLISVRREWLAKKFIDWREVVPFVVIFLGLILTAIGSTYYHLNPDNYRLVWDRLPMTLVFTALVSLTIMERVNFNVGFWLLPFLILAGFGSVWYWIWGEGFGRGDLRPYIFIQFYGLILILLIIYFFPKPYPSAKSFLWMIALYFIARVFEYTDLHVFQMADGMISGHTLKHLFAAFSSYWIVVMVNELSQRDLGSK